MTDERFEEFLRREAGQYNKPPPTPRDEIWASIRAARGASKPQKRPAMTWLSVAAGLAAVLIVGIGIGRWTVTPPMTGEVVAAEPADSVDVVEIYRVAAMDHLDQLDMFITLFQADEDVRTDSTTAAWARDLLSTTRLMLDSPAADDPGLRELLEDLELIMAQIASYVRQRDATELDLIQEDLDDDGILLRLKAELAVSSADLPAQGEI